MTGPSLTAQDLAREYIEEHFGYAPPKETVEDLALVIERFAADATSAAVDVCNDIKKAECADLEFALGTWRSDCPCACKACQALEEATLPRIPRCARCKHLVIAHEVDDEERRECHQCDCPEFEADHG